VDSYLVFSFQNIILRLSWKISYSLSFIDYKRLLDAGIYSIAIVFANRTLKVRSILFRGCMKKLLLHMTFSTASFAAESPLPSNDLNSSAALEVQAKYADYERIGQRLRTSDLAKELNRLDSINNSKITSISKPEDILSSVFVTTDDDMRAISYAAVLQIRSESGDPYASFYYGIRQWDFCLQLERQNGNNFTKQASQCWQDILPAFKRASDAQIADASFNIGKLYENGFGVQPSKLVAAKWYVKSAEQYNKVKFRDEALIAIERALDLVPDHPAAIRLRNAMVK